MQTLSDEIGKSSSFYNLTLQRGPRYKAYAELRESKLRMIRQQRIFQENDELESKQQKQLSPPPPPSPIKERERVVVTQSSPVVNRRNGGRSIVGSSIPNFSAILRKENQRPALDETRTPPLKGKVISKLGSGGGTKSANGTTEKRGVMMARKSYANIQELQAMSIGVSSAINGDVRGGRVVSGVNRAVLGSRLYGL